MPRHGATWASSTKTRSVIELQLAAQLLRRLTTALHSSCLLLCSPQPHQARQPGWCAGTCYCRADLLQGRLAEAVDAYERALAAAPNFEIVRNNLAIALTELGTRTKLDGEVQLLARPPCQGLPLCMPVSVTMLASCSVRGCGPHHIHAVRSLLELGCAHRRPCLVLVTSNSQEACGRQPSSGHRQPHCPPLLCCRVATYLLSVDKRSCGRHHAVLRGSSNRRLPRLLCISSPFNFYFYFTGRPPTTGDPEGGIRLYERALAFNPRYPDALYNLGVACGEAGLSDRAVFAYEMAAQLNPSCAEVREHRLGFGEPTCSNAAVWMPGQAWHVVVVAPQVMVICKLSLGLSAAVLLTDQGMAAGSCRMLPFTEPLLPPPDWLTSVCRRSTTWGCYTVSAATWSALPSATRLRCRSAPTSHRYGRLHVSDWIGVRLQSSGHKAAQKTTLQCATWREVKQL